MDRGLLIRTKSKIEIMNAFTQGKDIECRPHKTDNRWSEASSPTWDFNSFEYRIKPNPRIIYVNIYDNGYGAVYDTAAKALDGLSGNHSNGCTNRSAVKFVESTED